MKEHDHAHEGHDHGGHAHTHNVKATVAKLSPTQVKVSVEMPGDIVQNHENGTVRRYAQQVRIPGFRPGKAPLEMVKKKFREDILKEVVSHLVESGLAEALEQTKLTPVSRPKIAFKDVEIGNGKPFLFDAEFEVTPDIELREYKKAKVKAPSASVTEDEIKAQVDSLRERLAFLEPLEQDKPEKGNMAVVEIGYEVLKNPPKKEASKPYTVELGVERIIPELDKALMEMKVGEERKVNVKFPADHEDKELAGYEANYDCKLLELKKKVVPELDDTLASQLKEGGTAAAIREEVVSSLKQQKEQERERVVRKEVLDYLIKNNPFEVPGSLVEAQMGRMVQWMQDDFKRRGLPMPELQETDVTQLKSRAEETVRGSLLLREVSAKEKIELDESLMDKKIAEMAVQIGRTTDETVKWLEGRGMLERLKDECLTDQVYEFLLKGAEVKEA